MVLNLSELEYRCLLTISVVKIPAVLIFEYFVKYIYIFNVIVEKLETANLCIIILFMRLLKSVVYVQISYEQTNKYLYHRLVTAIRIFKEDLIMINTLILSIFQDYQYLVLINIDSTEILSIQYY